MAVPAPPARIRVAGCAPRGRSCDRTASGTRSRPLCLISSGPIFCSRTRRLSCFRSSAVNAPNLEGRQKRRGDQVVGSQILQVVRDPAQAMRGGERIEQARAAAGRDRGRKPLRKSATTGTIIPSSSPPSRSVHVTFSGSRVARRRQVAAAPNQTVASLHSPRSLISSISNSGLEK